MTEAEVELLPPFRLEPIFDKRIWGWADLHPWYDYVAPDEPIGEVWLSGDECKVATGPLQGKKLAEVFGEHSHTMLGTGAPLSAAGMSPLLVKVLFANEKLSVQVHPDDKLAQAVGQPRGKTECWYALAAESHAKVALGLVPGTTLEDVERGISDGTLEQDLQIVPVRKGDVIFVSAGTVHAIWPGAVLLETQQNSDTTYRLYDYGRPRELHVAKGLEATKLQTDSGKVEAQEMTSRTILIEKAYFSVEKIPVHGTRAGNSMAGTWELARGPHAGPAYLFAASGSARIVSVDDGSFEAVDLPTRAMVVVPASSPEWRIEDGGGLELIRITPRWPEAGASAA